MLFTLDLLVALIKSERSRFIRGEFEIYTPVFKSAKAFFELIQVYLCFGVEVLLLEEEISPKLSSKIMALLRLLRSGSYYVFLFPPPSLLFEDRSS